MYHRGFFRRTAKSVVPDKAEAVEDRQGRPLDRLCRGTQGLVRGMDEAKHAHRRVRQRREAVGQARSFGGVAVFVPPAILEEVQAVFQLPMTADVGVQLGGTDRAGVAAGDEVPAVVEQHRPIGRADFAIGAENDLAAGNVQMLTEILGIGKVEPQPAGFRVAPLFSSTSEAGRACAASAKQVIRASRTSGWLALTWNKESQPWALNNSSNGRCLPLSGISSMLKSLLCVRGHHVLEACLKRDAVVLDAGAHRGEFSRVLKSSIGCRCYALEPNPQLYTTLQDTDYVGKGCWALGSGDGRVSFVLSENPEAGHVCSDSGLSGTRVVETDCVTLQTAMRRFNLDHLDLLKLDVEGAEFDVLRETPAEVLDCVGQITVEFHDFLPAWQGMSDVEGIRMRLEMLGFLCCRFSFRTNGDVLFINTRIHQLSAMQRVYLQRIARLVERMKAWWARTL